MGVARTARVELIMADAYLQGLSWVLTTVTLQWQLVHTRTNNGITHCSHICMPPSRDARCAAAVCCCSSSSSFISYLRCALAATRIMTDCHTIDHAPAASKQLHYFIMAQYCTPHERADTAAFPATEYAIFCRITGQLGHGDNASCTNPRMVQQLEPQVCVSIMHKCSSRVRVTLCTRLPGSKDQWLGHGDNASCTNLRMVQQLEPQVRVDDALVRCT